MSKLQKWEPLPQDLSPDERYNDQVDEAPFSEVGQKKHPVNQQHLKNAWEASQRSTRDDWLEWMRRFSMELLKESPSPALRACAGLAGVFPPLARELFNSAFISCYTELFPSFQEECLRALEVAITSVNIPPEILQILLNLLEFMEHDDKALPLDIRKTGMYAAKCHAFAKALHYKELEFLQDTSSHSVEVLISINNQLQQSDAAVGILRRVQGYQEVTLKETWFERLQRWEEALQAYQRREQEGPTSVEVTMGKMRCLHALGEWDLLSTLAQERWSDATGDYRRVIAPLGAAAAWGLGQWDLMDNYLNVMKPNSPDRSFFGAILSLHRDQFDDATVHIERARDGLDTELSALLGESYNRAYGTVVRVQMLAELEEIITYKKNEGHDEKQETMRQTWMKRLKGCSNNVEDWQRLLKVRALVISPNQNMEMWIKFANLCRKSARYGLAEKALHNLTGSNEPILEAVASASTPPRVTYAQLKFLWGTGHHRKALENLREFTGRISEDWAVSNGHLASNGDHGGSNGMNGPHSANGVNGGRHASHVSSGAITLDTSRLLARCYLKQGEWQLALQRGDWHPDRVKDILISFSAATQYNHESYKAWHAWALANFEVVNAITTESEGAIAQIPPDIIFDHVIPAIRGFFKSISLSSGSTLQDTLRLLTLWFAHGGHPEVNAVVTGGFASVNVDTWLEVIPQLIARISQPNARVRQSIHNLLAEVGRVHPQALVYPLTVAMKSHLGRRSRAASQIMDSLRQHSAKLVEQAEMVSHELIRVAVLWHELWHEALEESSRLWVHKRKYAPDISVIEWWCRYFGDSDIEGMFATLAPLHELLDRVSPVDMILFFFYFLVCFEGEQKLM